MFIKLSLICMFISSINAANDVEIPKYARARKFFRRLAVNRDPLKSANRRWRGELNLSLGRFPFTLSTAVEFHHIRNPPGISSTLPCHQIPHPPSDSVIVNDEENISETAVSGIQDETTTTASEMTKSSTTQMKTLKLEDYDEITFDPTTLKEEEESEEENALNRVRRKSENDDESEIESTTVIESSTTTTTATATLTTQEHTELSSSNQVITAISTMLQLPQPNPPPQQFNIDKFPYSPSTNLHAQYIYITTHKPQQEQKLKNYYDFYPSQPDLFYHRNYYYNFIPLCITANTATNLQQYPHKSFRSSAFRPIVPYL